VCVLRGKEVSPSLLPRALSPVKEPAHHVDPDVAKDAGEKTPPPLCEDAEAEAIESSRVAALGPCSR